MAACASRPRASSAAPACKCRAARADGASSAYSRSRSSTCENRNRSAVGRRRTMLAAGRLRQRPVHLVGAAPGGGGHDRPRELAPQHRRHLQHRAGRRRTGAPAARRARPPAPRPRAAGPCAPAPRRSASTTNSGWPSVRRYSCARPRRAGSGQTSRDPGADSLGASRAQRQHLGLAGDLRQQRRDLGQQARPRRPGRRPPPGCGAAAQLARQQQQQQQRGDVGGVQVVEHQRQRPPGGGLLQAPDRRSKAAKRACSASSPGLQRRRREGIVVHLQLAKHLDPGPVGRRAARLPAAPPGHRRPPPAAASAASCSASRDLPIPGSPVNSSSPPSPRAGPLQAQARPGQGHARP